MLEITQAKAQRTLMGINALQSQMTFRFSVLSKLLDKQMAQIAADHDLTLAAYRTIATVQAFGELSAADLVRYTGYDKGVLSRTIATLTDSGLLTSQADPAHGLRKILKLTQAGAARLEAARPAVEARREALSNVLGPEAETAFLNAIETLVTHLDQELR